MTRAEWGFSPRAAARYWQRNATVGRRTLLVTITPRFIEAVAYLALMGLGMGTYLTTVRGVDYVTFIAPGVAATTVMFGAVIETTYNTFVRIHIRRVFEAAVTTPLSVQDVVVGEYLWAATRALGYGVIFLMVMVVFGLAHSPLVVLCVPVMALGALMFAVLGLTYTAFVSNIEHFNIFYTGVLTPMFLFGGVFFPFDQLPAWARFVGWCLPLSHLVEALRDLSLGEAGTTTALHVAVIALVAALAFPVPLVRLGRTLRR